MLSTTLPPLDEIIENGLVFDSEGVPNKMQAEFITAMEPFFLSTSGGINYYLLPPELNQLAIVDDDPVQPFPQEFVIIAAFDNKGLAARTMLIQLPHIEGTWVREDLRKGRVGYKLIKEMELTIKTAGRSHALAYAADDDKKTSDYLSRMGYSKMPITVWSKDLTKD